MRAPRPRRAPAILRWAPVIALGVVALGVGARWVDLTWRLPQVQSVFPVFGGMAVLLLLAMLAARRWRLAAAAALVAAAPVVIGVQSMTGDTVPPGPRDEVVMTSNLELGSADPREVVAAVRAQRVTTLVLTECTPPQLARLRAAGLDTLLPEQAGQTADGPRGTVIRSRHPLRLIALHPGGRFPFSPEVQVGTGRGSYRLRAVHTAAPLPDIVGDWRAGLRSIGAWQKNLPQRENVVMAGDFNASAAMPAFRKAIDGMTDSSRAAGAGWRRTWPHGRAYPPFVQLDHVVSRGFGVVRDGTVAIAGTDHLTYWARLRPQ
ncbi:endonuclease/exonuclease/phosphatase family protein [Flexivirga sp. ID2601S]|uniref:Endonuclease/exonuclease/phosphatase family protein n=1 Tax=Flexivirga aerilata TaxID=1656889 RepID=A0A849ARZ0_9MICO|nr:endonuclease/exonuclease/phosphatase family protein [Flexivirga aerilata]NNG39512.1 endonuclease/exonuclease/phosphatase family protein [Flexivirga aerilata]